MDNPISGVLKINIHKLLSKNSFEKLSPDFPQLPLPCCLQTELSVSFCFSLALQMTPMPSFQLAFPPPEPLLMFVLDSSLADVFLGLDFRLEGTGSLTVWQTVLWCPV